MVARKRTASERHRFLVCRSGSKANKRDCFCGLFRFASRGPAPKISESPQDIGTGVVLHTGAGSSAGVFASRFTIKKREQAVGLSRSRTEVESTDHLHAANATRLRPDCFAEYKALSARHTN